MVFEMMDVLLLDCTGLGVEPFHFGEGLPAHAGVQPLGFHSSEWFIFGGVQSLAFGGLAAVKFVAGPGFRVGEDGLLSVADCLRAITFPFLPDEMGLVEGVFMQVCLFFNSVELLHLPPILSYLEVYVFTGTIPKPSQNQSNTQHASSQPLQGVRINCISEGRNEAKEVKEVE